MNLFEEYISVHNFFDRENITFSLLKDIPHVKDSWDIYSEKRVIEESAIFVVTPHGIPSGIPLNKNTTQLEATRTSTQYGPTYIRKGTKQYLISPIFSIPYATNWVSKTLNDIWCSNAMVVCIDTLKKNVFFGHHIIGYGL
jgi:hypothetical protein